MSSPDRNDPIFSRAADLPAEISPERDLWSDIAARLDLPADAPGRLHNWHWSGALAAGLVVVAVTAAVTWRVAMMQVPPPGDVLAKLMQSDAGPRLQPGVELVEVRNELLANLQAGLTRLPPESQRIVTDNLLEIRASLNAIEAALSLDPDDASLQQLLYTTYEQELQILGSLSRVTQSLPVEVEI